MKASLSLSPHESFRAVRRREGRATRAIIEAITVARETVAETLRETVGMSESLTAALAKVGAAAQSMQSPLGVDSAQAVMSLTHNLSDVMTPMTAGLKAYSNHTERRLHALLEHHSTKGSSMPDRFEAAFEKVGYVDPPEWAKNIIGFPGRERSCEQAFASLKEANDTVREMSAMLWNVSSTLVTDVLYGALGTTTEALIAARSSFVSQTDRASTLQHAPVPLVQSLRQAGDKVFVMADGHLQAKIEAKRAHIADKMASAWTQVQALYATTQEWADQARASCVTSEAR
eukprot:CAMPEP_0170603224 /NCGR_PEP_ID=MMETSP0224-20130122/18800_1 /TAXON_ID=285029 /ORGANISM="Togula jolla, Strain CCCM 725" /LENGTH=287 /DNA_ID=CAMNT_0010928095 /DNA_START=238 /DNA_END=1101 /DNA_ORIENTATION=-